ncbi:MAG TPA: DUF2182 domain-containing protein [Longimicrobiales bacterium]|nr:DUF2182 domain-containing protein [Longimicrobiales bacterium]
MLERVLKRDRSLVLLGLAAIAGLAWIYIAYLAASMPDMDTGSMGSATETVMPQLRPWGIADVVLTFIMWGVMMVAMMVPSVAPMVLLFATLNRKRHESSSPYVPTVFFLLGYLLVWAGFSAGATGLQWGLHSAALLSPMMVATSPLLGGGLLAAAGVFQFTPLKRTCLRHCRSPLHFLLGEWDDGEWGALAMGVRHGSYCVGCCWILMVLLFVAGVMNLLWVAAITVFVLVERVLPAGELVGRLAGVVLIVAGFLVGGGMLPVTDAR